MFRLFSNLLIYYLLATMTLSLIGQVSKKARFFSRLLSCYFLLMTCAAYGVLASVVLRLAGRKSLAQWATARAFKAVVCPAVGVEFKVIGEEKLNTRPAVFMSNHQAYVCSVCKNPGNGVWTRNFASCIKDCQRSAKVEVDCYVVWKG